MLRTPYITLRCLHLTPNWLDDWSYVRTSVPPETVPTQFGVSKLDDKSAASTSFVRNRCPIFPTDHVQYSLQPIHLFSVDWTPPALCSSFKIKVGVDMETEEF